jgi:hypothetical protein
VGRRRQIEKFGCQAAHLEWKDLRKKGEKKKKKKKHFSQSLGQCSRRGTVRFVPF